MREVYVAMLCNDEVPLASVISVSENRGTVLSDCFAYIADHGGDKAWVNLGERTEIGKAVAAFVTHGMAQCLWVLRSELK